MSRLLPALLGLFLALGASPLLPPAAARASVVALEDSTWAEEWTLGNGLRVVTRNVPGAKAVSIVTAYRFGSDDDPPGRGGFANLLAEVAFTAPAGSVPARTREEMESVRPLGWNVRVSRRFTEFTEAATREQFPGVLHESALRMRGVQVRPASLRTSLASVHRQLGQRYFGSVDQILAHQVREFAAGADADDIVALGAARALDKLTAGDVATALGRVHVPANAVLAIAGDLTGVNVHALVEREFGDIPAGSRVADPSGPKLDSTRVALERAEAKAPVGVVGLLAPALSDSLSPSFYLAMLVLATHANQTWGTAEAPLSARFQYSLLDDPFFVRFYPRLAREAQQPADVDKAMDRLVLELLDMTIVRENYDLLRTNVMWILGGAMPPAIRRNVAADAAALNLLATNMAARAFWGDASFWREYRRRLDPAVSPVYGWWGDWLLAPQHRAVLLVRPRP